MHIRTLIRFFYVDNCNCQRIITISEEFTDKMLFKRMNHVACDIPISCLH